MLENKKKDAKKSYKSTTINLPSFIFKGKLPIHIENHNGNTPAKYKQFEILKKRFKNFNNIKIKHNTVDDAACYQKEVVEFILEKARYFYIINISFQNFDKRGCEIKD